LPIFSNDGKEGMGRRRWADEKEGMGRNRWADEKEGMVKYTDQHKIL